MEADFDVLDKEFELFGNAMLNQKQVDGIFNRMSIKKDIFVQNILLVDDASFMRCVVKNILTENGFFVVSEAEDGVMAIKEYKRYRPDLVIMNITMPVLDGIGAAKLIKDYDSEANIIMLSGISNYHTIKESIKAGACGFIAGSFDIKKFITAINSENYVKVNNL